eukprot:CAMPEP_0179244820 /NCGR_PEP_ID=MMETSP0797-20121207/18252_1 /TAXON_ID=47934 /ORGANISM="Dinophysis acuminata, Strain DAEP01" /LENGTH=408 /DNA_ID=CAMNT_0020952343 /DNA_START=78 /DNA_END=1304 /DNA_ORIENTATION=+
MADWDPFAVDEDNTPDTGVTPAAVAETKAPGDGRAPARIKKDDVEKLADLVLQKLNDAKPWNHVRPAIPDLSWHTPTYTAENWQHHDVRLEVGTGIAYIIFNRPNENNSMQDTLGAGINDVLWALHARKDLRVAVFTGEGRMYCAGGDPKGWQALAAAAKGGEYTGDGTVGVRVPMNGPSPECHYHLSKLAERAMVAGAFPDGNVNIGRLQAAKQWHTWSSLPQFTICLANGSAMGGGVGCVCCCDYVIAVKRAYFVLSEVKIGVIPATISPYVIAKMGVANAKRLFCCAENLTAQRAQEVEMVDEVVENMKEGHERVKEICKLISNCGPDAVAYCKQLVTCVAGVPLTEGLFHRTCQLQGSAEETEQAKAGMECEKKGVPAPWVAEPISFDEWPTVGVGMGKGKKGE